MTRWIKAAPALLALIGTPALADGVDPLRATIATDDTERFVALFAATDGAPSAEQLQRDYLDRGGQSIALFTPGRIESAEHLAQTIAAEPDLYARAINTCLPWVAGTNAELRATYLGLKGLLPEMPLPEIAVVIGANNSGGTAGPGMQVLGLEVLCRDNPTQTEFRASIRQFFAHETVHTMQQFDVTLGQADGFLISTIAEGTADYIAMLVTGRTPEPARDTWAREREGEVLRWFADDLAISRDASLVDRTRDAAAYRWLGNAGDPPEGWPSELGYWVGMRIAHGYVAHAPDPHAAIRELLALQAPRAILAASGLGNPLVPPR